MPPPSPAIVLAAVAPVTLVAIDPAGWYPFGPVKWLAVSVLVPMGTAVMLARRPLRVAAAPTAAAALLLAWLAVAALLGEDRLYAWIGTPERHLGVVAWALAALALVAGQSLGADRERRVVAAGLVVAGAGLGAAAVAEALGWAPDVLDTGARLGGLVGSPAYLGAAAALLLPALLGVVADPSWHRGWRAAAAAAAAGLAVATVGSGARAAWFGLAVACAAAAWARRGWLTRLARRPWPAGGIVAAGAGVLVVLVVAGPVGDRLAATLDAGEPGGRARLDEWRVAARVIGDDPLTGAGPEGYRVAFGGAVDAGYERAHGRDPQPDRAHSTPLDIAAAGGLAALAAWVALVALTGRSAVAAFRGGPPWLAGIAASLVAHAAGGLFLFPVVEIEPVSWLLAGLLIGASPAGATRARERPAPRPAVAAMWAVAAVALVAGLADVAADRHARRAADALAAGDGRTAVTAAASATGLRPDTVRLHLLEGRARIADRQGFVAGLAAVDRALAISPGDPVAQRERARLLVGRAAATRSPAHVDAARAEVERMLARDPVDSTLWALAAVAADLDGEAAAARRALGRAEDLSPRAADGT